MPDAYAKAKEAEEAHSVGSRVPVLVTPSYKAIGTIVEIGKAAMTVVVEGRRVLVSWDTVKDKGTLAVGKEYKLTLYRSDEEVVGTVVDVYTHPGGHGPLVKIAKVRLDDGRVVEKEFSINPMDYAKHC